MGTTTTPGPGMEPSSRTVTLTPATAAMPERRVDAAHRAVSQAEPYTQAYPLHWLIGVAQFRARDLRDDHLLADIEAAIMATLERTDWVCLGCGCTQNRACVPPCSWTRPLLCSACTPTPQEGRHDQ